MAPASLSQGFLLANIVQNQRHIPEGIQTEPEIIKKGIWKSVQILVQKRMQKICNKASKIMPRMI